MNTPPHPHDSLLGVLTGSALGDAIGLYTEFLSTTAAHQVYGPSPRFSLQETAEGGKTPFRRDTHRAPHEPGNWTDDTDHAVCLLLSFLHRSKRGGGGGEGGREEVKDGKDRNDSGGAEQGGIEVRVKTEDKVEGGEGSPEQYPNLAAGPLRTPAKDKAEEVKEESNPSPKDLATRIQSWASQGLRVLDSMPLGLGKTIGTIICSADYRDYPQSIALSHWRKTNRNAAANGSLMRTHLVGLFCVDKSLRETFDMAGELGIITHVDPRCVASCAIGSGLVRRLVRGEVREEMDVDEVVEEAIQWYDEVWQPRMEAEFPPSTSPKPEHPQQAKDEENEPKPHEFALPVNELREYLAKSTLEALELDDPAMGYVLKCLSTGLILLRRAIRLSHLGSIPMKTHLALFEDLITELVMCGGDADTNACFAGALLGGYLGYKALPPKWRDGGLKHGGWFLEKGEALAIVLRLREGTYDGEKDRDTWKDGGKGFLTSHEMDGRWAELTGKAVGVMAATGAGEKEKSKMGLGDLMAGLLKLREGVKGKKR